MPAFPINLGHIAVRRKRVSDVFVWDAVQQPVQFESSDLLVLRVDCDAPAALDLELADGQRLLRRLGVVESYRLRMVDLVSPQGDNVEEQTSPSERVPEIFYIKRASLHVTVQKQRVQNDASGKQLRAVLSGIPRSRFL